MGEESIKKDTQGGGRARNMEYKIKAGIEAAIERSRHSSRY